MDSASESQLSLSSLAAQLKPPRRKVSIWPTWVAGFAIISAVAVGLSPRFIGDLEWRKWAAFICFALFEAGGVTLLLYGLALMSKPLFNLNRELMEQLEDRIVAEEKLAFRLVSIEPQRLRRLLDRLNLELEIIERRISASSILAVLGSVGAAVTHSQTFGWMQWTFNVAVAFCLGGLAGLLVLRFASQSLHRLRFVVNRAIAENQYAYALR